MQKMQVKKIISLMLSAVLIFVLIAGFTVSASEDTLVEGIYFPTFDEWYTNTYSSGFSAFSTEMPVSAVSRFSASANDISKAKYIGLNGGKFIAEIEPIADKTGWIEISNRTELALIGINVDYPLNGKYYLSDDIDLSGTEWTPIGNFTGTFDGQGYVISNLTVGANENPKNIQYAGLFGIVDNATIKNVGLEGTYINIYCSPSYFSAYAGGIFAFGFASVNNCYNTGNIYVSSVSSDSFAGGICGKGNTSAIIINCYNASNVSAISFDSSAYSAYAGGICGESDTSVTISNCYNTGNVSASAYDSASAGGICGKGDTSAIISNCYNTGDISASATSHYNSHAGGICGYGYNSTAIINSAIINCYNTGSVSALSPAAYAYAGGICGKGGIDAIISNCYNTGSISAGAASYVGGMIGGPIDGYNVTKSGCYWNSGSDSNQIVNGSPQIPKKGVGSGTDDTISLTSEEMESESSFAGFDFDEVWKFIDGDYKFPVLRVFYLDSEESFFDYTVLLSKVNEALAVTDNVIVSVDGSELWKSAKDRFWVTAEEKAEFYEAVTNSYKVIVEAVSQSEIDLAAVNLDNAIQTFLAARKQGIGTFDYSALTEKIDEAIAAKANVIVSKDGSELSESTEYHWWVTKDVMDKFNNAIMTAANKLVNTNQSIIEAAASELDSAITEFLAARKRGIGKFMTNYTIQGTLIADILPKTNRLTFANNFYLEDEAYDLIVNVYNSNGKLLTDGDTIGTGMTVKIMISDEIAGEFEAVINGDITGDGNVSIKDAARYLESLVGNTALTPVQIFALTDIVNENDSAIISLRDFLNFMNEYEYELN